MLFSSLRVNTSGWGPAEAAVVPDAEFLSPTHASFPFGLTQCQERLGRPCDFTYQTRLRQKLDPKKADEFQIVQEKTSKKPKQYKKPTHYQQNLQQGNRPQVHIVGNASLKPTLAPRSKWQKQNAARQAHRQAQQAQQNAWYTRGKAFNEWSIEVAGSWTLVSQIELNKLAKLRLNDKGIEFEELGWRGSLGKIDRKANEKITPKKPVQLLPATQPDTDKPLDFYWNTTTMDELLAEKIMEDDTINVAATDRCLAALMAAAQSRYSWHLVVRRFGNSILIDKRDGSTVDTIQVNETNRSNPPNPQDPNRIDRPMELSTEAVKITQDFSQQILSPTLLSTYEEAPFVEEGDIPARQAYRYRTITLPPIADSSMSTPVKLVTRSDVDASISTPNGDKLAVVRALLESDDQGPSWINQLDKSRGGLSALEFKNNACSLARWLATCLLAGAETLYLGWISRCVQSDNKKHRVLLCQQHAASVLSEQIGLSDSNLWGILRYFLDQITAGATEDGTYILVKEPMKNVVKLYRCPDEDEE